MVRPFLRPGRHAALVILLFLVLAGSARAGSVSGRVTDKDTGQGVSGVLITVYRVFLGANNVTMFSTFSDANGNWSATLNDAYEYRFRAYDPAYRQQVAVGHDCDLWGSAQCDAAMYAESPMSGAGTTTGVDFALEKLPAPVLTSASVTSGPVGGGTEIVLTGNYFYGAPIVTIGDQVASRTVTSATSMTVTTRKWPAGPVNITVRTNGTATLTDGFTFTATSPPPTVTSISPTSGPAGGYTTVTLTGTNLVDLWAVTFGGTAASTFSAGTGTTATATTRPWAPGMKDLVVTTLHGSVTVPNAFEATGPTFTSVTPTSGPASGGTTITLTGTNFRGTPTVRVGGVDATNVNLVDATTITATTPAGTAGAQDVMVTTPDGSATLVGGFTYGGTAPTLSSVSPSSGPAAGGTSITLTGSNFAGTPTVTVGGADATSVTVVSSTTVTAVTPAGTAGPRDVVITTAGGTATLAASFTYVAAPTLSSVSPSAGPVGGGTTITLAGTNFTGVPTVTVGNVAATSVTLVNATTVTAVTPAGTAGTRDVVITTAGGTATLASGYTYLAAPTLTSVSPALGPLAGGTPITLTGTNFLGTPTVTIGGVAATSVAVISATSVTAVTPAGTAGFREVAITTEGGQARLAEYFRYVAAPTLTAVLPSAGPLGGGTTITLTGTNFSGLPVVTVGGAAATSVTVVDATTVTAVTPSGTAGPRDVAIATAGGTAALAASFTYVAAPTLTSVGPAFGATTSATAVTLTGSHFIGTTSVSIGATPATSVSVVSPTTITAVFPAGSAGARAVTVTTAFGSVTAPGAFTYVDAPTVTSVRPAGGTEAGGALVGVFGTNLTPGTTVTIGGQPATDCVVYGRTAITCRTPAGTGTATVAVAAPGGTASAVGAYAYLGQPPAAPTLSSLSPAVGWPFSPIYGSVVGANLTGDALVVVGDAPSMVPWPPTTTTSLFVSLPALAAGDYDVSVTTPGGTASLPRGYRIDATIVPLPTAWPLGALYYQRNSLSGPNVVYIDIMSRVAADTNGVADVYSRRTTSTGSTYTLLSRAFDGSAGNGASQAPVSSATGRYVAFVSDATNLVPGDTNERTDVFLVDRDADADGTFDEPGAMTLVRASVSSAGVQGNGFSGTPDISADGQWVTFGSSSTNLVAGDTNDVPDVFLHHVPSRQTFRVSVSTSGAQANGPSTLASISGDGRRIIFQSAASNLVAGDTNGFIDIYLREWTTAQPGSATGTTTRLSTAAGSAGQGDANGPSVEPVISRDGSSVTFMTAASNIELTQWSGIQYQGYASLLLRLAPPSGAAMPAASMSALAAPGQAAAAGGAEWLRYLLSRNGIGRPGNGASGPAQISDDGRTIVFASDASDLVPGDTNGATDAFVIRVGADGVPLPPRRFSVGSDGEQLLGGGTQPSVSPDGRTLAFVGADGRPIVQRLSVVVGGVAPTHAPAGATTEVRVTGEGFLAGATVRFGGRAPITARVLSDTELAVDFPATGGGIVDVVVDLPDGASATLPQAFTITTSSPDDGDNDGLPSAWEQLYGLNSSSAAGRDGGAGDADGDGVSNTAELAAGTHPNAAFTRYLAEGATSTFFSTRLALANPSPWLTVTAIVHFQKAVGGSTPLTVVIPPMESRKVSVESVPGMAEAEFATLVESDGPIVVDRLMSWDRGSGYGSHAEASLPAPSTSWYLAEGATHSGFELFYLLQNPSSIEAQVKVRYLRPSGAPLERTYPVAPGARYTIWVDQEQFDVNGTTDSLASTDVSAAIESTNGVPIVVERAMYLNRNGQTFAAGHESAGIRTPSTDWFLAEGATLNYFDEFLLLANPNGTDAQATITYLLEDGTTRQRTMTVPATSRQNIWVNVEQFDGVSGYPMENVAHSTRIAVTNGVPIVVERAMWWPRQSDRWAEAHNSPGAVVTGTAWAVAEGQVQASPSVSTYLLVANASATAAEVKVTLLLEGESSVSQTFTIAPTSRQTIDVGGFFPEAQGKVFGALVESVGAGGEQIVVECAIYSDAQGVTWAAGSNHLATRLR